MKTSKIFSFLSTPVREQSKRISGYDPNNVTRKEFREFVHYLAENKINRTFVEPEKYTTETERLELQKFRERINYLAKNKINHTFIC